MPLNETKQVKSSTTPPTLTAINHELEPIELKSPEKEPKVQGDPLQIQSKITTEQDQQSAPLITLNDNEL